MMIIPLLMSSPLCAQIYQVRNGGFGSKGPIPGYFTQENVKNFRKSGWKCPDASDWPQW